MSNTCFWGLGETSERGSPDSEGGSAEQAGVLFPFIRTQLASALWNAFQQLAHEVQSFLGNNGLVKVLLSSTRFTVRLLQCMLRRADLEDKLTVQLVENAEKAL